MDWIGQQPPWDDAVSNHDRGTGFVYVPATTDYCGGEHVCSRCGERMVYSDEDVGILCWACDNQEPARWIMWVEGLL